MEQVLIRDHGWSEEAEGDNDPVDAKDDFPLDQLLLIHHSILITVSVAAVCSFSFGKACGARDAVAFQTALRSHCPQLWFRLLPLQFSLVARAIFFLASDALLALNIVYRPPHLSSYCRVRDRFLHFRDQQGLVRGSRVRLQLSGILLAWLRASILAGLVARACATLPKPALPYLLVPDAHHVIRGPPSHAAGLLRGADLGMEGPQRPRWTHHWVLTVHEPTGSELAAEQAEITLACSACW